MTEISGADQLMSPYCTNAFSIFVDFISTEIFFTEEKVWKKFPIHGCMENISNMWKTLFVFLF